MSYDLFFRSRTPAPPAETSAVRLTTPRARPILPALDGDMSSGAHEAVAGRERIVPVGGAQVRPRNRLSLTVRGEGRLAYALLAPTLLVILFLVAYPFCAAIYLSVQDKMVGAPGRGVGLANYMALFRDAAFLRTARNSAVPTVLAVSLKFVLGLTRALSLEQERGFSS